MAHPQDDELTRAENEVTRVAGASTRDLEPEEPRHVSRDRYRLGAVLGKGGMAVVYEADDTNLKRQVALKQMHDAVAGDPAARRRFFAEAEILAGLDHAGLVSVHEAGVLGDGSPFYAMAKVKGQTLAELMEADRASGLRVPLRLVEILQRAAETVGFAHGRGIIHLDLKPPNIMVDADGAVLVMDWGIARRLTDPAEPGVMMGTASYMSPEVASGRAPDARSDVFALGVMLYEVLTGQRPFTRPSVQATLDAVKSIAPVEPRRLARHVPRELSAICVKAMAKDPAARYATARELAADLRDYRAFLPISAIQPTRRERIVKWLRRHPRATAAIVTAIVAVLGFGSIRLYRVAAERAAVEAFWSQYQAITADVERLEVELAAAGAPSNAGADIARAELRERIRVRANDARSIGAAMIALTRGNPDPRIVEALSARMHRDIADAQDARDYVRVKVLAETRLALMRQIQGQVEWPAHEVAFLQRALDEAQAELARQRR
jgi:tRNA A-37 threonylcarbamoyl transferase component Bud32